MRLALSLLWILAVSLSLAAQTPAPPEVLRNSRGEELRNPRVLKFDGYKFDVEHAEGITTIPWDKMPASWRAKFNRLEAIETHGRGLDAERERLKSRLEYRQAGPDIEVLVAGKVGALDAEQKFWVVTPQRAYVAYRNGVSLSQGDRDQLPPVVPLKGYAVLVLADEVPPDWQRGAFVVFKAAVYKATPSARPPATLQLFVTGIKPWDNPLIVISQLPAP